MRTTPGMGKADWLNESVGKWSLLGSCASMAILFQAGAVSAGELEDTLEQLRLLQERIAVLEARQGMDEVDERESVGVAAPAAAVEAGDKPRSWKLPGTNTSMQIGGYAKLDLIYDVGPSLGDSAAYTNIPAEDTTADRRQQTFRAHARQSRFWIKTWTPTDWGELATHIEGDFYGSGGNELTSNSSTLRLRRAYGTLGPILGGQDFTTFEDLASEPQLVDFANAPGTAFARQAMLRYTHVFGGGQTSLQVAVENPETTGLPRDVVGNAGPGLSSDGIAIDRVPDVTGKLQYKFSQGHVALRGLFRYAAVDSGGGDNDSVPSDLAVADNTPGWAVGVSGRYKITSKDVVGGQFNYGEGAGRYLANGGSRNGFACSLGCETNGSGLKAMTNMGGNIWYRRAWTDTIRTNVSGSVIFNSLQTNNIGAEGVFGETTRIYAIHGNIFWSPVPNTDFGLEVNYGNRLIKRQGNNDSLRIQIGLKYSF